MSECKHKWKPEGFPIDERNVKRAMKRCTKCGASKIETKRNEGINERN